MKTNIIIPIIAILGFLSCKQATKSTPDLVDTEYEYTDNSGKKLIIKNGLPKGGMTYTDPNGMTYSYRILWTQIINETDYPFELSIKIPASSFELQSSPADSIKIYLPIDEMNIDKISLSDYGLTDLDNVLDDIFLKQASLQKTVNTKETSFFYVVILFNEEYEGVVRAGFSIRDDELFYRVNDVEISCGENQLL
ncbi:MAG: hypothetical protein NXI20_24660 [bacterium]|nr:hypothetical protein [bacterium]